MTNAVTCKNAEVFTAILPPPSARSLLLTVVGELLHTPGEGAWTTALLEVLGGLGIEQHAARQLLSRAAAAGWLERERQGRAACWRLADGGMSLVQDGIRRSDAYLEGPPSWDGQWLMLFVTVPNDRRATRNRLYGGLNWLGMGNPVQGVWVTPHIGRADELTDLVHNLDLAGTSLAVVGSVKNTGLSDREIVDRAWDLSTVAESYGRLLHELDERADPPDDDAVLLAYLRLLNVQQRLMRRDPYLPRILLPEWIGREGAARIRQRRQEWGPTALGRWAEIVDENAPT
ncbi:PaaX family transcriptional regulator [Gordonia sp. NPDC003376]